MSTLNTISEFLQKGRVPNVKENIQIALDEGIAPKTILEDGLLSGMAIVGEKFKNNEVYVPEVLIAARAMNAGIEMLKPLLVGADAAAKGSVVLGTVKGDLHDIGKNLVKMMMESKGLEVVDLGVDVSADKFVEAAKEHKSQVIACSALLTTTMPQMKEVVTLVKEQGLNVKVMIGGAPITKEYADSIGADCYTSDAVSAADAALAFCI